MRRLFWLGVGAVAGASGTVWAEQKLRRRVEAMQPDHLALAAAGRARGAARAVVDAVAEGRDAMREREAELRGEPTPQRRATAAHRSSPGHRAVRHRR